MRDQRLLDRLVMLATVLLFLTGCTTPGATAAPETAPPPTSTPTVLITSVEMLVGSWEPLSDNPDAMFLQVDSDGTCRLSYTLEGLASAPQVQGTCSFEGTELVMTALELNGVAPCPSPAAMYEVRLLTQDQIQLVATEEDCSRRRNSTQHKYQRIP